MWAGPGHTKAEARESLGKRRQEMLVRKDLYSSCLHLLVSKYLNIPEQQNEANTVCL